ncbi:hypothetical protein Tco_0473455, partial [Tanacetum coccineum]
ATSASGSHLLTWTPRGLPSQWQLANQLSLHGGDADKSDINAGTRLIWRLTWHPRGTTWQLTWIYQRWACWDLLNLANQFSHECAAVGSSYGK